MEMSSIICSIAELRSDIDETHGNNIYCERNIVTNTGNLEKTASWSLNITPELGLLSSLGTTYNLARTFVPMFKNKQGKPIVAQFFLNDFPTWSSLYKSSDFQT